MKLVFLGSPGVGKGSYATKIKEKFNLAHISTGDLLREEVKKGSELGLKAKSYMDKGELVPDALILDLLKARLSQQDCVKGFILDGFPRTIEQAESLVKITDIDKVVFFYAPKEVIIERISGRRTCSNCGAIYHVVNKPPKIEGVCDLCGGKLIQRSDEKPDVVEERLKIYEQTTKPLIEYYKQKNKLVEVQALGSIDEIVDNTIKILGL